MNNINIKSIIIPDKYYLPTLIFYFFLMGSQLCVNHWLVFIIMALFLIDWKKLFTIEVAILFLFLLYVYTIFPYFHREILGHITTMVTLTKEAAMVFLSYMLGLSFRGTAKNDLLQERKIFYLLYIFFIAYSIILVYSYFVFPQDAPLNEWGMRLYYKAIESMPNIDKGRLVSTIIEYSLNVTVTMIPFLIFDYKDFRNRNFKWSELLLLLTISFSSLYFAAQMGRRMTILILLFATIFFIIKFLMNKKNQYSSHQYLLILFVFAVIAVLGYYLISDTLVVARIKRAGFIDSRMGWWPEAIHVIFDYPWGGGGKIRIADGFTFLAHNAWLDIGKRYGILALLSLILFWASHIKYFVYILTSKNISTFMKNLVLLITAGILSSWMIEPVYFTQKTFTFFTFFFLGFVKTYSNIYKKSIRIEKIFHSST